MRRSTLWLRLAVVLVGLLTLLGLTGSLAAAQEEITFRIAKFTCSQDPGNVSLAAGNIPDYCDPTAGVAFTVTAEDGTTIGSCTTDATGLCSLNVPNEATVTVTEDETTGPAGYVPRENPITTQAVTEFAGALFINIPAATPQPTAAPQPTQVPQMPSTGAGPRASMVDPWLIGVLAGSLLCGSLALSVRRRSA